MAVDTPAVIAILGAGPIGLETALYARYLGYDVLIFEQGNEVADHVRQWGHVRMFTPFRMNRSPLGLAAVRVQDADYVPPADDQLLTGNEWREKYLVPLAQTDLLADHLRLGQTVIGVTRTEILKADLIANAERGEWMFRIVSRAADGSEFEDEAEIVIDTTGVFSQANWAGEGGLPALGESAANNNGYINYHLPDILGQDRQFYAGKQTLVIGSGYSAATNLVALAKLAEEEPGTGATWLVRKSVDHGQSPLARIPNDPLPARDTLAAEVEQLVTAEKLRVLSGSWLQRMDAGQSDGVNPRKLQVTFGGQHTHSEVFDSIIANVGFRPDRSIYEELQVQECYATQGPLKLAATLLKQKSDDCLAIVGGGPESLLTSEPNFYILGSKSFGRNSQFLFSTGLTQIRELFTIIGERATLDLYANAPQVSE